MNKKTVIAIVLILILVIGGGFWIWRQKEVKKMEEAKKQQEMKKQEETKKEETTKVDTSGWKTYRDEKYRFEIKYNPEWEMRETEGPAMGGDYLEVIVDKNRNDIGMGINRLNLNKDPKVWYKEEGIGGITYEEDLLVNGYRTYYIKFDNPKVYLLHEYLISGNNKIIVFGFTEKYRKSIIKNGETIGLKEASLSQYLPEFEAMVYSIKFFD